MTEAPKFDNIEDANKHIQDIHRGNELLGNQKGDDKSPPALTKEDVTAIVADALKENSKQKGDADARLKEVMLQDDSTKTAIKKTFKEEKGYDEWEKEVKDGKVSIKEIELLQKRGQTLINTEAENAKKENEKNVPPPDDKTKKLGFEEGHNMLNKVLSDPKKDPNRPGLTKEQAEQARATQSKEVAAIMDRIDKENINDDERISLNVLNEIVHKGHTTNPDGSTMIQ